DHQAESNGLGWEVHELRSRAVDAGLECRICPAAEAVHLGGASVRQVPARWVVESHRGMYRYFKTRRPAAVRPWLWLAFAARASAKVLAVAARLPMHERALRGPRRATRG